MEKSVGIQSPCHRIHWPIRAPSPGGLPRPLSSALLYCGVARCKVCFPYKPRSPPFPLKPFLIRTINTKHIQFAGNETVTVEITVRYGTNKSTKQLGLELKC